MSKHLTRRQRRAGRVRHEPPLPKTGPTGEALAAPPVQIAIEPPPPRNVADELERDPRAKLLLAALFGLIDSANLGPEPDGLR